MSVVSSELDAPVRWDINTPPSEVPREMPTRADFCSLRPGRLNPAHYRWGPPTAQPIFIEPTPSQMPARFQRPCVPDPFDRSPYRYGAKRPRESDSEGDRQAKARRLAALAAKRARKAPNLGKLPFEVRERILRLLLVSTSGPIYLSDGWTRLCRHSRQTPHPELSTRILESCKTIYREGVRILYGRNTFLLRLRDPPIHSALDGDENDSDAEMDDDAEGDDDGDYQDDAVTEVAPGQQGRTNSDVPEERNVIHITKYAPLFKHIIIEAEFVRNDRENLDAMAAAIRTFIPPRGRLPKTAYRPERDPVPIDEVYTHRLKKDGPVKKTLLQLSLPEILTLDIHITPHPLDEPLVPDLPEQQQDDDQQSDAGDQQQQEGEEQLQNGEEDGLAQQMQQMLQLQQATAPVRCTFLGFFDWKTCRVMKAVGNLLPQCLSVQVTPRALGSGIEVPTLPRTEIDMRAQRLMLRRDAEKRSLMIDFGEAHNDFWQGDLTMAQERWTRSKANQEALRQLASDVQACCWRYADVVEAEALQAMDDME